MRSSKFTENIIYRSNRSQLHRRQKRYNQASNQAHHNTSSEGLSPSSNGINQIINEDGDAEIDIIEERGSSSSAVASEQSETGEARRIFSGSHVLSTCLHFIQMTLAYLLMLVVMTFNTWLCLAVVLGSTLGYFFVGWKKPSVIDVSDHCH